MSAPRQDGTERDAWLSEALRHAPDAQAAPPSALSDAILRQARAATAAPRAAPPSPAHSRWQAAWGWLARPSVAAGFASVMVATVLGLMWWDQPMNPTIARAPAADATPATAASPAPPPAATAAPQPAPQQAAAAMDQVARATAKPGADPALPQKRAAPKATPPRDEPMAAQSAAPAAVPAAPAPAPAPAPAQVRESPTPFTDRRAATEGMASASGPPATGAPAPASVLALRAREPEAPAAAEGKAEAALGDAHTPTTAGALARSAPAKAAAPAARRFDNAAEARAMTLNALLTSVAAQPERWGWERDGTVQPIAPALQRWFAGLAAATAAARGGPALDSASAGEAAVLRLYRDGVLNATLRLDDASVGLVAGPRTALPSATLAALKQALDDATR